MNSTDENEISAVLDARVIAFVLKEFALESQDPTFVTKMLEFSEFVLKTNEDVRAGVSGKTQAVKSN